MADRRWKDHPDFAARCDAAIRERYPAEGPSGIAAEFGLTVQSVSTRAYRIGVKTDVKVRQRRRIATNRSLNTSVNHAYFESWSPNSAWLLGYTWADGAVVSNGRFYKLTYRCKEEDAHVIHDIRAELRSEHKVYRIGRVNRGMIKGRAVNPSQPQVGIAIMSERLVRCLIERHGIVQNKSSLDPPMPQVPDEFMPHFARGVFDGDGCLTVPRPGAQASVIFCGSHRFMRQLHPTIARLAGVRENRLRQHGQSATLLCATWSASPDVVRLLEWMYPPTVGLSLRRKFLKARGVLVGGLRTWGKTIYGTFHPSSHPHLSQEPLPAE